MQAKLPIFLMILGLWATPTYSQGYPRLMVVDDIDLSVRTILPSGKFLTSFPVVAGSKSSIAHDPSNDTLWGTGESADLIVHYTKTGQLISQFPSTMIDPNAKEPEGIDVNPADNTLWIVDDSTLLVYHVTKEGLLIGSFPTTGYDPLALSPQGLAYDTWTDTLWLTDNSSSTIYNVSTTGQLISSFPASLFDPGVTNPQDISVPRKSPGILWIAARNTATVYQVTTSGALISSLPMLNYGSGNPTGVLFDDSGSSATNFCTAKTTVFCGPASISASGTSSATATSGFVVSAAPWRGCRWGMLLFNDQPTKPGAPFGGPGDGMLCLSGTLRAAGMIDSGGTAPSICDGVMSIDMNAFAQSLYTPRGCHPPVHSLQPIGYLTNPGTVVNAQMFGRDSLATGATISNGLTFVICP